ncbi:hypothetical protein D0Z07_5396 [Hyphodiscus hymeniophilus]|uniref:Conserved oligomeric Golgi complex subunit 1 n=1 Tax=Hyphodiscus hymeniophilus TaxID=353542 RepID=A0A9P6VHQ2_9HELO|nr:hypothetical protein D0Z07_5396 [Hyphodiscus hymeniophilus]
MSSNRTLSPTIPSTASEAFKYPPPQVRQFHRNLTAELDEKNDRLRTLVGGSYRQLLGTAEMILQMREDINVVEEKLGNVGRGCGSEVIGRMAGGLGKLQRTTREGEKAEEVGWLARMKILGMCEIVVGTLLRRRTQTGQEGKGKNLVTAAKAWVLSRLLAKSLSDSSTRRSKEDNDLLEESKRKLATLRRRILRAIERTLGRTSGEDNRDDLVLALCAYSLATSSGTKDVLRHFLRIRGEAITLAFEDEHESKSETTAVLRALELYTRTLLDVQALVPRRLSQALASLKTKPLLKDQTIRDLEELRLDVCERWFGDEILYFTPYNRHDDLEGSQAVETLKGWAKKADEVLLQGLAKVLHGVREFKAVVELRTKILEVWIKDGGKAKGFDPSSMLDGLRRVINDRMVDLLESRVSKLHLVGTEIEASLGAWRPGFTDVHQSLWDEEMLEMGISNGANLFKHSIVSRTYGRSDAVSRAVKGYQMWRHLIDEVNTVLDQLKKQRWDDDLEDIEDDLSLESRNTLLSTEDPNMLQDQLDLNLEKAYSALHQSISSHLAIYKDSEHIGQISMYILRILRDIRSELPKNPSLQKFGLSLVPSLHEVLASTTAAESIHYFSKRFTRKRVAGRGLWEGSPEMPVQPSPATFKFHHSLVQSMAQVGADLWSPAAVGVLKRHLRSEISRQWNEYLELSKEKAASQANEVKSNDTATDGGAESPDTSEPSQNGTNEVADTEKQNDILIQSLFDIFVLQSSLEVTPATEDELQLLANTVELKVALEPPVKKRLHNAAREYWRRTGLLFGLLG